MKIFLLINENRIICDDIPIYTNKSEMKNDINDGHYAYNSWKELKKDGYTIVKFKPVDKKEKATEGKWLNILKDGQPKMSGTYSVAYSESDINTSKVQKLCYNKDTLLWSRKDEKLPTGFGNISSDFEREYYFSIPISDE
jgi:hypothetical protein